jgi:hypothetical protein
MSTGRRRPRKIISSASTADIVVLHPFHSSSKCIGIPNAPFATAAARQGAASRMCPPHSLGNLVLGEGHAWDVSPCPAVRGGCDGASGALRLGRLRPRPRAWSRTPRARGGGGCPPPRVCPPGPGHPAQSSLRGSSAPWRPAEGAGEPTPAVHKGF